VLTGATFVAGTTLSSLALDTTTGVAACLTESALVLAFWFPAALVSAFWFRAALDAFALVRGFASDERLPISHTQPTTAAIPAPTPRQILGPIGGRSGFVWHHLHSPSCSG